MENNTSRIIIETVIKKTLKELKDSPQRSIRNLVDMALQFSTGRFHRNFFEIAQTMLQNETSPYYELIEDIVCNVNSEKLLRFGINLGYNSCTVGAKTIREKELREQYNIPWIISLHLDSFCFNAHQQEYQRLIQKGEEMGIYTWALIPTRQTINLLSIIQKYPDSAFILFCRPEECTTTFLESIAQYDNVMLAVRYDEGIRKACKLCREAKLLYSVYFRYTEKDAEYIMDGEIFRAAQEVHPVFTALYAEQDCTDTTKKAIYEMVKKAREQQLFQTFVLEITYDICYIDQIISNDACLAEFDTDGYLHSAKDGEKAKELNLFENDLEHILKSAFPK